MLHWLTDPRFLHLVVWTFFGLLNLAITIALRFHPLVQWVDIAQRRPRLAAAVRLMKALGIDPVAALQALADFVRNEASPGTKASAAAFQVQASKPLFAPAGGIPASQVTTLSPPSLGGVPIKSCPGCRVSWSTPPDACPQCGEIPTRKDLTPVPPR
jgi:hypothetical protein